MKKHVGDTLYFFHHEFMPADKRAKTWKPNRSAIELLPPAARECAAARKAEFKYR